MARQHTTLKYFDPAGGHEFSLASLLRDGRAYVERVPLQCQRAGLPERIGMHYLETVVALIPGGTIVTDASGSLREGRGYPTLATLMASKDRWLAAIRELVEELRKHLDS